MADDQDSTESTDHIGTKSPEPEKAEIKTGQIPLLEDVVFNTELPFPKPKATLPNTEPLVEENAPRPADLFGGSPDTAQTGPLPPDDMEGLRRSTEQMVNELVAEYSQEIVKRLREDLTSLLDELQENPSVTDPENPAR
jgi:hypothetical protein